MGHTDAPAPMSEPVPVSCILIEGVFLELRGEVIRLVGYIHLEVVEETIPAERRIVARVAMPLATARQLVRDLRRDLIRGAH